MIDRLELSMTLSEAIRNPFGFAHAGKLRPESR